MKRFRPSNENGVNLALKANDALRELIQPLAS
jgi:hypothetical protein